MLEGLAYPHPHATLSVFETDQPAQIQRGVRVILEGVGSLEVSLHSVGSFLSPEGVVYLTPTLTEELLLLHRRLAECVSRWGRVSESFHQPGKWVPHCTLGIGLSPEQIARAIQALQESPRALRGRIAAVAMVDLERLQVIWEHNLA